MDYLSPMTVVLSATFQFAAAIMAVRLIRVSDSLVAWMLLAGAFVVMGFRRLVTLTHILNGQSKGDMSAEILALLISLLMVCGIWMMKPVFVKIKKLHQALNEELEQRVLDRTRELQASNLELTKLTKQLEGAYSELQLAQSKVLQQEKMASLGQLAAGIAHEINNPMGFIKSNLNSMQKYSDKIVDFISILSDSIKSMLPTYLLQDPGFDERLADKKTSAKFDFIMRDMGELITECLEGAERVQTIVQNLKSFSRLDEAQFQMADINSGLESTINIVWNELKYKVTLNKEYGILPLTMCNLGELNQIFLNILMNAAQAINDKGKITIKTASDDGWIKISIADTGEGIAPETLEKIFDPFFTTKEVGKGTGLGLSIAYDIVKKHNGEIRVESEVGNGTTFTILLPVTNNAPTLSGSNPD